MANTDNVTNIRANYTTGAIMTAPVGTTLPTSATAPTTGFSDWGYVGEDGITKTIERETENKLDMNGSTVFVITKSHSLKFKFKPLELRAEGLKATLGDNNVDIDAGGNLTSYRIKNDELVPRAYMFNLLMADGRLMRVVCPKGQIASTGEDVLKASDLMSSEIEIEMLTDENDVKAYVYFANPTTTGKSILTYSIRALGMDFPATINEAAGTVDVTVPNGTTLTALVATFTASAGATVKVGSTAQVSGTTANDFTNAVTYAVTASTGGAARNYTVTVTAASA